ncbi:MAG: hypothetical protein SGILL_008309 [Bacillariaceae sp.]
MIDYSPTTSSDTAHKAGGLPQTISAKKVIRLLEQTPIKYYAGTTKRARMHVTTTSLSTTTPNSGDNSDDDYDYYVWYAWKGADLKNDGYLVQVFQVKSNATPRAIVAALHQYGELDEDNPLMVAFDKRTLWYYMMEFQKQKDARRKHGLAGVYFYLYIWKRLHQEGITEEEVSHAVQKATTVALRPAGWVEGGARLRFLNATDVSDSDELDSNYDFIVVDEDSDLGNFFDVCFGWIYRICFGDDGKRWGMEWGRHAVYKFYPNATVHDRRLAIQAFHTGKTTWKEVVNGLFHTIWPDEMAAKAGATTDIAKETAGSSSDEQEESSKWEL